MIGGNVEINKYKYATFDNSNGIRNEEYSSISIRAWFLKIYGKINSTLFSALWPRMFVLFDHLLHICSCPVIPRYYRALCFRMLHSYTENPKCHFDCFECELSLFIAMAQHVMYATDHCSLFMSTASVPCQAIQFHAICSHQHQIIELLLLFARRVFCFPNAVQIMPEFAVWTTSTLSPFRMCCIIAERQSPASCQAAIQLDVL